MPVHLWHAQTVGQRITHLQLLQVRIHLLLAVGRSRHHVHPHLSELVFVLFERIQVSRAQGAAFSLGGLRLRFLCRFLRQSLHGALLDPVNADFPKLLNSIE